MACLGSKCFNFNLRVDLASEPLAFFISDWDFEGRGWGRIMPSGCENPECALQAIAIREGSCMGSLLTAFSIPCTDSRLSRLWRKLVSSRYCARSQYFLVHVRNFGGGGGQNCRACMRVPGVPRRRVLFVNEEAAWDPF